MKLFGPKKQHFLRLMDVACAVIRQEGKILITRRRKNDYLGGLWEFPGGKRIAGESLIACLVREIVEELAARVEPLRFLKQISYRYPDRQVHLYFYECRLLEGRPWPRGCQEFRWVLPSELRRYDFPPADEEILRDLVFQSYFSKRI